MIARPRPASVSAERVLAGVGDAPGLATHLARFGPLPSVPGDELVHAIEASGLLGRGGAGFPAGRKLRTVALGRRPVVVGNGAEGEPASGKDALLLSRAPHLVLDGLAVAARAVGAKELHLAVHAGSAALAPLRQAIAERQDAVVVHELPPRYVASESSALVHWINGGEAKPVFRPPHTYEKGVHGRPTLVNNVETLAHMALIARYGAGWYRAVGDPAEPGTMLLTITTRTGREVLEVPTGVAAGSVLEQVGVRAADTAAVLVGGYFGTWLTAEQLWTLPLTHDALHAAGGSLGAGILLPLPCGACGLAETAHIARWLAAESAGQCGPCLNGLPAIAGAMAALAGEGRVEPALRRWLSVVPGRGACAHPDGAVRMVASALTCFAADVQHHAQHGPCPDALRPSRFPLPAHPAGWR
ncbi:MAG: NADH-ubiquinone oxidoreductase-F iron-sulfur binding region domain-containing protein [Jatrophihabitans sp.]|uniref:NADH-ubiquinone oxidoreductase-F iron-sulfur binding region domain-containing protein n=1 Tax=Jatrophihabitans sp. TaxID=1932789 RepID=UPI003F7DEF9F